MNEKKLQKEKVATRKNNIALNIVIILLLATIIVSAVIGLYAWAKYTSAINGDAEAQVAKWHFDLTNTEGTSLSETGAIDLAETIDFEHVVSNRIAPGTYGLFQMVVDTRGTEVDLVYEIEIALTDCPTNLNFYTDSEHTNLISKEENKLTFSEYLTHTQAKDYNKPINIYWNWPYETLDSNNSSDAGDAQDKLDQGKTVIMNITATGTQVLSSIPVSSLTSTYYGQYVDIGTSILGEDSEAEADWRVFYKDATGGVWLMLSDYLSVTDENIGASTVSSVGLETSGKYCVKSNTSRKDLIDKLNGDWSSLISGSNLAGKEGVKVKGAVDLETWVASWNEKYPNNDTYPTNQIYTAVREGMSDAVGWGYKVSRSNPPSTSDYYVSMSGSEGYKNASQADKLYYPHASTSNYNGCYGYWLASPSAYDAYSVMIVDCSGYVRISSYLNTNCGVCPAVYLPSNIKIDTSNKVWTIVNE